MTLLLHGVVWADARLQSGKLSDRPDLVVVEEGDLAVAASEISVDTEITDEHAVDHLDALAWLAQLGPVLPLRFGTLAPDTDAVRSEIVRLSASDLRRGLEKVRDLVELRMIFVFDESAGVRAVYEADPELRQAARDPLQRSDIGSQIALGQRVAERWAELRTAAVASWASRFATLVERSMSLPTPEEDTERLALLVRRERVPEVDSATESLRTDVGDQVGIEYVGPLPVVTFLDDVTAERTDLTGSRWGW